MVLEEKILLQCYKNGVMECPDYLMDVTGLGQMPYPETGKLRNGAQGTQPAVGYSDSWLMQ